MLEKYKSYIAKISKDDLVNLLHKGSKELEDLADLKAIHENIDELKNNVIKLILEENKKLKERDDSLQAVKILNKNSNETGILLY